MGLTILGGQNRNLWEPSIGIIAIRRRILLKIEHIRQKFDLAPFRPCLLLKLSS